MINHAIEIGLLLLSVYLAGCTFGYLAHLIARRMSGAKTEAESAASAIPQPHTPAPVVPPSAARRLAKVTEARPAEVMEMPAGRAQLRPPELPAPRFGRADDLRKIKGIGQKTESLLHDLGIYHFDQIAAWEAPHIAWLEGRIAIKGRIGREQWVEQAVLLLTAPKSNAA